MKKFGPPYNEQDARSRPQSEPKCLLNHNEQAQGVQYALSSLERGVVKGGRAL